MTEIICSLQDNNIFHVFAFELIVYYTEDYKKVYIYENNIKKDNPCQKWRFYVMNKVFGNVTYTDKLIGNVTYGDNKILLKRLRDYNWWKFIEYKPDPVLLKIYHTLAPKNKTGKYILFNQRGKNNRYLYEYKTKMDLQDYLAKVNFKLPFKWCNFETMTPEQQYEICSDSAIFVSAHGAGCTNMIFTPINTPMIEISFRTHWYCDNVCDDHFSGKISINEKCNGVFDTKKFYYNPNALYYKADFHNLSCLLNKPYCEIQPVEYGGKFNGRNPISKQQIFVDGEDLIKKNK